MDRAFLKSIAEANRLPVAKPPLPTRCEVYAVINGERDYQDSLGKGPNGRTDGHTKQVGVFLSLMHHALNQAHAEYYGKQGDEPALHFIRKIAALAVQCMEIHGAPPREKL